MLRLPRFQAGLLAAAIVVAAIATGAGATTTEDCVVGQTTETVLENVTLTWDSAFECPGAESGDSLTLTVNVWSDPESAEAVELTSLVLSHTTPRPRGVGPVATASTDGLPLTIEPGGSASFEVTGTYELVTTDEGEKANLHLRALGTGKTSGEPFELGVNVLLRGEGADDDDGDEDSGPPSWVPGPPPWAGPPTGAPQSSARR